MSRVFLIDAYNDGHVSVKTLTHADGGGNSHDRKLRRTQESKGSAPEPKWRVLDKKIFRKGITEPVVLSEDIKLDEPMITLLPFGSEEMVDSAMENDAFTEAFVDFAAATVKEIDEQNSVFDNDQKRCFMPKVKKVVLVYENGMVEDLC